jgi:hypothetical protein
VRSHLVGRQRAPLPLLRRCGGAAPVSPATGYLARCLPRATLVFEPLSVLHLTVRVDADGRAAPGLLRVPDCAPWLEPRGPVSVMGRTPAARPRAGISPTLFISFQFRIPLFILRNPFKLLKFK